MDYGIMRVASYVEKFAAGFLVLYAATWAYSLYGDYKLDKIKERYTVENFFVPKNIYVGDTMVGEDVELNFTRDILQEFWGTFFVEVRTIPTLEIVCPVGTARVMYHPDSTLPDPITLAWWTNNACTKDDLDIGTYILRTTWLIDYETELVSPDRVTIESNPFRVTNQPEKIIQKYMEEQTHVDEP